MLLFLLVAAKHPAQTPVRATFGDGQVLMGAVETRTLKLQTGSGLVDVPLSDVGEVVPAGDGLGNSDHKVNVWLRNGSELRGQWADPKLAMRVLVGGEQVGIDLPLNDLNRFQLQAAPAWPTGPRYRVKTSFGDDFFVDPTRTQLTIDTSFGELSPFLSECSYAAPVGDPTGEWVVKLVTGTVLRGKLHAGEVTLALPMGPDTLTVPMTAFAGLSVESARAPVVLDDGRGRAIKAAGPAVLSPPMETARGAGGGVEGDPARGDAEKGNAGWFDAAPMRDEKAEDVGSAGEPEQPPGAPELPGLPEARLPGVHGQAEKGRACSEVRRA